MASKTRYLFTAIPHDYEKQEENLSVSVFTIVWEMNGEEQDLVVKKYLHVIENYHWLFHHYSLFTAVTIITIFIAEFFLGFFHGPS